MTDDFIQRLAERQRIIDAAARAAVDNVRVLTTSVDVRLTRGRHHQSVSLENLMLGSPESTTSLPSLDDLRRASFRLHSQVEAIGRSLNARAEVVDPPRIRITTIGALRPRGRR